MTTRQRALAKVATKPPRPVAVIEDELYKVKAILFASNHRLSDARRSCFNQRIKSLRDELAAARAAQEVQPCAL
jgi:hypothetical protein